MKWPFTGFYSVSVHTLIVSELYQETLYQIVEVGAEPVNFTCTTTYREASVHWSVDGVEVNTGTCRFPGNVLDLKLISLLYLIFQIF